MEKHEYQKIIQTEKLSSGQKLIISLLSASILLSVCNLLVTIGYGYVNIITTQQSETKTDQRYYNLKDVSAYTHNIWVNEFTKETFTNEKDYRASLSDKNYKRQTIKQKWLKSLIKN